MNKLICIVIVSTLILSSCKKTVQIENKRLEFSNTDEVKMLNGNPLVIDIDESITISSQELISKVAKIRYVPLDSKELIGDIRKMVVTEKGIYIMDSFMSQAIFVFDKQGKLKFCIDEKGMGPNEYISIWDMQVDEVRNEIMINDALGLSYKYYSSIDGSFIRKEKGIQNCYVAKVNDLYFNMLGFGQAFNKNEDWQLVVTDKDSVLYKGFKLEPIQKNDYMNNNISYTYENEMLYTPVYSDTIYKLNKDLSFTQWAVIKQEKSVWNECSKKMNDDEICKIIKENDYTRFSGEVFDTKDYISFAVNVGYKAGIIGVWYFFNKKNKDLIRWDMTKTTSKDEIHDCFSTPIAVFGNEFYSLISLGKDDKLPNLSPELSAVLPSNREDSNPIVAIYSFE